MNDTEQRVTDVSKPAAIQLERYPFQPCDAHAEPTIQAIYEVALDKGTLLLCAHCAYEKFMILEETWLHAENKKKGSEN